MPAEISDALRQRLTQGLQQIAFFVIPSAVAFILLGDVIVATTYRTGHFQGEDVLFVWGILAGSAVGLLASTSGRLYSSVFYALRNTRTPLKFALIRLHSRFLLAISVRFNCRILLALTRVGVRVVNFATAFCFYEPSVTVTVSRSFCFVGFCNLYSISQLRA